MKDFLQGILTALQVLIPLAVTYKSILILQSYQGSENTLPASWQKIKPLLKGAVICETITALIKVIQGYYR